MRCEAELPEHKAFTDVPENCNAGRSGKQCRQLYCALRKPHPSPHTLPPQLSDSQQEGWNSIFKDPSDPSCADPMNYKLKFKYSFSYCPVCSHRWNTNTHLSIWHLKETFPRAQLQHHKVSFLSNCASTPQVTLGTSIKPLTRTKCCKEQSKT